MSRIKILVDSGADMPVSVMKKYDISVIPMIAMFGGEVFIPEPGNEEEFYEKLRAFRGVPTTSQTPPELMRKSFAEASAGNETVIYFAISGAASGQYSSAKITAEAFDNIRVIDTRTFSLYITDAAVYASRLASEGRDAEEIERACRARLESWQSFIAVDSLMYLERGGRLKKTSAVIGTVLDIKPVLTVSEGLIKLKDKLRGGSRLINRLIDRISAEYENPEFMVVDSDKDKGDSAEKELTSRFGAGCVALRGRMGALIGAHIGSGALAVIAREKNDN